MVVVLVHCFPARANVQIQTEIIRLTDHNSVTHSKLKSQRMCTPGHTTRHLSVYIQVD